MQRWIARAAALVAGVVISTCPQVAGAQGKGMGRVYDPKTVETVAGEVTEVQRVPSPGGGRSHGVHLVMRTDDVAKLTVHLGPAWYVDRQDVKIAVHDRVEVKGSRVTIDGQPVIVAAEVKKGDQTLVLRDADGVPAWGGAGRGKGGRPSGG